MIRIEIVPVDNGGTTLEEIEKVIGEERRKKSDRLERLWRSGVREYYEMELKGTTCIIFDVNRKDIPEVVKALKEHGLQVSRLNTVSDW